jgi:hypothetical protein
LAIIQYFFSYLKPHTVISEPEPAALDIEAYIIVIELTAVFGER